jgi:potassium-transporting ATPase KdpC subunit
MLSHLRPAIMMLLIMTLITGIAYPLAMTGIAQMAFNHAANGSAAMVNGKFAGSELIGQTWASDRYFHGRPSAAGTGYDASASGGSNLGATARALMSRVGSDVDRLRSEGIAVQIPADAVEASGSGLDPDISPAFAGLQVARVAKARGVPEEKVRALVAAQTVEPFLGIFGQPRVNVLLLNIALDRLNSLPNG